MLLHVGHNISEKEMRHLPLYLHVFACQSAHLCVSEARCHSGPDKPSCETRMGPMLVGICFDDSHWCEA
jgi:hypothetical protein